jgi:hypothetical protein
MGRALRTVDFEADRKVYAMTEQTHREWQRETVLRRVSALRDEKNTQGRPYTEKSLAETCCGYVGVSAEQVLKWMGGQL